MPRFRERIPSLRRVVYLPAGALTKDAQGCVATSDATSIYWLTRNGFIEVADETPRDPEPVAPAPKARGRRKHNTE